MHNRSLQVVGNASAEYLEYLMKYFSIKADEADLAEVEHPARDLQTFREIAAWAQRELENFDDQERAATIQRQLLPRPLGDIHGYTVAALCLPAHAVGGDFYDHYLVRDGAVFTVADVMGKGLGAAILAAGVRSALRAASWIADATSDSHDLAATVRSMAEELADDLANTDTFVTMFHAKLDPRNGRVDYVDAGHGFAAVLRPDGGVQQLNSGDLPVGVLPDDNWTCAHVILQPGETLVIASDGALELIGDDTNMPPVHNILTQHTDPAELCEIARSLHVRTTPLDDVTIVAIRRDAL